jgi:hypothetical protein
MRRYSLLLVGVVANTAWAAPNIDAGSLMQQIERDRHFQTLQPEPTNIYQTLVRQ